MNVQPPIHIAAAHGPVMTLTGDFERDSNGKKIEKCSYHVVVDIACDKALNKFVAQ